MINTQIINVLVSIIMIIFGVVLCIAPQIDDAEIKIGLKIAKVMMVVVFISICINTFVVETP